MSNTKIKAAQFHGVVGHGTDGYFLMTNADGSMSWAEGGASGPSVTSVAYPGDDTAADPAGGQTVVLTGTNFGSSMSVTIGGTAAPSVAHDSSTQLTITTPAKAAGDYDIVVTNTVTGTSGTFVNGISYNGIPTWTTAAGSLGTFESETTISTITLAATEPDGGTITFNITNGALPTGLSLTGANIDGTTTAESSTTLYSFTIEAIDDENQATPRNFSITVNASAIVSSENFTINTYTGNGSTQSIEGKIGTAAEFNGSSSKILTGSGSDPIPSSGAFSLSAWVKTTSSNRCFISFGDFWLKSEYTSGVFGLGDPNTTERGTTDISDGSWHHCVLTVDASNNITLYVDGTSEFTGTKSISRTNGGDFAIGVARTSSPVYYWLGNIDQVRIFNKELSSSEVTTLYGESNASTTKSTTDIFADSSGVALYEFEKGANDTGGSFGSLVTGSKIDLDVDGYTSGSVSDLSGNSNTATVTGATYGTDSNGGGYFDLDGSSDYLQISTSTDFNSATNFTVEGWFNPDNLTAADHLFAIYGGASDRKLFLRLNNTSGDLDWQIYNSSGSSAGAFTTSNANARLTANEWNHVAVTHINNGSMEVFVNGVSAGTGTSTGINTTGTEDLYIGVLNTLIGSYDFDGKVGDIRFYDSALTSSQIVQNFNASKGSYGGGYHGTPTNVNFLGMAFQPDLVWIKQRNGTASHSLQDSVRGAGQNYNLYSDNTAYEGQYGIYGYLSSFDTNGFSVAAGSGSHTNANSSTYVAWCWKAGGAAVSDSSTGTLTANISANTAAGFSIVNYTGNQTSGATFPHGLDSAAEMVIIKNKSASTYWFVYHKDLSTNYNVYLNDPASQQADNQMFGADANVVTVGSSTSVNSSTTDSMIAYCFHSVDGYQKIGSYTGTGSNGNTITTGFRPRFVMIKSTTASPTSWVMVDALRDNADEWLYANESSATYDDANTYTELNTNGFTVNNTASYVNASGHTYIYLAIA